MVENHTERYTVTAALIYANGPIHIGHLAGCYLPADIYVRFLRKLEKDVVFISGTDEHGVPITIKAKKENTTPQAVVDKFYAQIKDSFKSFGISFDIYSRTSHSKHHEFSKDFFLDLYNKGVFVEQISEQFFDEAANQFLADRYIVGTCPHCGNENAYGDQCEKCGSSLSPQDLKNPKSTLSGNSPVLKKTKNWYLPLDQYQSQLESYIKSHPEWKPTVYGQCMSWLNQGLQSRAMTRDLDWGVPVPLDEAGGKVLYVWFDAPLGYITFTQELFQQNIAENERYPKLDPLQKEINQQQKWEDFWKNDNTKLIHFIGKDNIVFHCIIFPAMLMAQGSYILPHNVPANEFMNLEGQKISTSRNWAVWLHEFLEDFPQQQDALRYALCTNAPESKDNDFTWKEFQLRNNSELVAILGNFVNRVAVLSQKYYNGIVPKLIEPLGEDYIKTLSFITVQKNKITECLMNFKFRDALSELMELARIGNKFLADAEPWKLIKDNQNEEKVRQIMFTSLQICAALTHLMEPFLPFTAQKMAKMLNVQILPWNDLREINLEAGHSISEPELLFNKIEDQEIEKQMEKLKNEALKSQQAMQSFNPLKENITFDDFSKLDIRVGKILEAELVPKTKKLMKLIIDIGLERRTVISGIAEHYKPEECLGKKVCFLANLAPREIKGVLSQGMILMAENAEGKLSFMSPEQNFIDEGSIIA
ncbi:MAG: methionine--tRNA ligase [Cytophagales bacterium]